MTLGKVKLPQLPLTTGELQEKAVPIHNVDNNGLNILVNFYQHESADHIFG